MSISIQFGLYLMLMPDIGCYSMRRTKNNEDFIIGCRTLGPAATAKPSEETLRKFDHSIKEAVS